MKPYKHICKNCWYYKYGECLNRVYHGEIRRKEPDDVCDGGGIGTDSYGFKPKDVDDWVDTL